MKPKEEPAEAAGPSGGDKAGKEDEASTAPLPEKVSSYLALNPSVASQIKQQG